MTTPLPIEHNDGGDGGAQPTPANTPTPTPTATPAPTPPPSSTTPSTTAPAPAATSASAPQITGKTSSVLQEVDAPVATYVIPLSPVASQVLAVTLGNQACTINLYTRSTGLYLDLLVADVPICTGVICLDRNIIVRAAYLGFQGELTFIDSQGTSDPTYDGFGARYNLVWLDY